MGDSGATGDGKKSPFGNGAGSTVSGSSAKVGGHNFTADPKGSGFSATGGRDFTKESRPQQPNKTQVGLPNAASIPSDMGGKILKADPKDASTKVGGANTDSGHKPFKLGK